jgi:hypothetical protein
MKGGRRHIEKYEIFIPVEFLVVNPAISFKNITTMEVEMKENNLKNI